MLALGLGLTDIAAIGGFSFLPGATLDMPFLRGAYLGATPAQITTTRASTGYAQNSAGVWVPYAANVARLNDRGLTNENTKTNGIRNATMAGAVAGTPGTLPTNWSFDPGSGSGLSQQIVGTGVENGISYIDVRVAGTPAATTYNAYYFDTVTAIAAAQGQTWTGSFLARVVGGSTANVICGFGINEGTAGGAFLTAGNNSFTPTSVYQRATYTRTLTNASTGAVLPYALFNLIAGQPVDITLRIGWPQLEQGAFASTPIPTSGSAATRATDINELTSIGSWFTNNAAFTLYYEGVWDGAVSASTNPFLLALYGAGGFGTNACGIWIEGGTGKANLFYRLSAAQTLAAGSAVALTSGVPFKIAARFQSNEMAYSLNGAAVVTQALPGAIPTITTARIGGGDGSADGRTFRWGYIPGAANDTNLRALAS